MRKVFIRRNTIGMVLLAINHVAMAINATEARNGVDDPDGGGRLESDEVESGNKFSFNIHNTCLHIFWLL